MKEIKKLKFKVSHLEDILETSLKLKILCQIDAHKEQLAELEDEVGDENVENFLRLPTYKLQLLIC